MTASRAERDMEALRPEIRDDQLVIIDAAIAAAVIAERERIYAELGNEHFVIFTEDRWTIEHSVGCRLSGHMHQCKYHEAVAEDARQFHPEMLGRWRIDGVDSEGLPVLVRDRRVTAASRAQTSRWQGVLDGGPQ